MCVRMLYRGNGQNGSNLGWLRASTAVPQILPRGVISMVGRKTWIEGHSHRLRFYELFLSWRRNDLISAVSFQLDLLHVVQHRERERVLLLL